MNFSGRIGMTAEERFWPKVDKKARSKCWIWTASKCSAGYGTFRVDRRTVSAHRFSWELRNGPIPPYYREYNGLCVCHKCDTPACVNPHHLFLSTQRENMLDMTNKGRASKLLKRNSYIGEKNGGCKINELIVNQIKNYHAQGCRQIDIGLFFGLKQPQISRILSGKRWSHLK